MREGFELRATDAMGRIGSLAVPRSGVRVETPALMPVVNPHLTSLDPARLGPEFGVEILITNAYIVHGSDEYREDALDRGLHDLLGFDGAIMTDSGAFQLAAYGEISVTTEEILAFQRDVGADIATPVDVPTPPDVPRERAERELATTEERLAVAEAFDRGDMLVAAPIQGSTHLDLRERAAAHAYGTDLDLFPVGAMVPLLEAYRFADVVDVVMAAKRGLGADAPVHLFGAGHPMMLALAVAAGCDLFDSAAYAIYARDDRYLTVRGTAHLDRLEALPCACAVCADETADGLRGRPDDERERLLAEHNLRVTLAEVRRIRDAVRAGDLLELVEARARAHPAMLDGYRALLAHGDRLEPADPASKGTFFYLSAESAGRPEVRRHHGRLDRLAVPDRLLLVADGVGADAGGEAATVPDRDQYDAVWRLVPPFGPVPPALAHTYPLNAEVPARVDGCARERAADGVAALVDAHPDAAVTVAHDGWPPHVLERLPGRVTAVDRSPSDG